MNVRPLYGMSYEKHVREHQDKKIYFAIIFASEDHKNISKDLFSIKESF